MNISAQHPFFFFHIPKTAGSTLQGILLPLVLAATEKDSAVLAGRGHCEAALTHDAGFSRAVKLCTSRGLFFGTYTADSAFDRYPLPVRRNKTACASVFFNHFSPAPLFAALRALDSDATRRWDPEHLANIWGGNPELPSPSAVRWILERSMCVTILRDPALRSISYYYEFVYRHSSNLSAAQSVAQFGMDAFVRLTMPRAQTGWLGPSYEHATAVVDSCIVGITERFEELLDVLAHVVPMVTSSKTRQRGHSTGLLQTETNAQKDALVAGLRAHPLLADDYRLYRYAITVSAARLL